MPVFDEFLGVQSLDQFQLKNNPFASLLGTVTHAWFLVEEAVVALANNTEWLDAILNCSLVVN